jgi:hypothetical protein
MHQKSSSDNRSSVAWLIAEVDREKKSNVSIGKFVLTGMLFIITGL